ncbi:ergosterol biosynthesis ERG4/ERG24 [Fadolivirus algeromassiliense]|jgi:7-dehydrocholesterol reductase|uniref:7-dehydrocholesterol reductase n=1 Tax=Fadolivirus FV1/VV64 TaxID=3070911 RepID=A0A7D3V971_9VIRU|nr:ergosterol biosynthesis ERG4/ERG24 [Fadolivirus algeromassiliense]QKF94717.1 ergosterol biosynthesis ERG4/ERG24 [Fadolivirus FV1/VV64]
METWGRSITPCIKTKLTVLGLFLFAPLLTISMVTACLKYQGDMLSTIMDIIKCDFSKFPKFDMTVLIWLCIWIIFQYILAIMPDILNGYLPKYKGGWRNGQHTPAGNIIKYNINGLQAWIITHILYFFATYFGIIDPAIIAKKWGELFVAANIIGYSVCMLMYIKALYWSTHPEDDKKTGYHYYDIFMGIEFNPEIFGIDAKLFWNGRPGIIAWTLINASFASLQYQKYGYVSNSMIIVNLLQALYVVDFFWNENWYLKTIDIAHDHFGWYFAWGDSVWLPFCYTLQSVYLASNPTQISTIRSNLILLMGIIGYVIFRMTNYQKDFFRRNNGNCRIWGEKAKYLECEYTTTTGKVYKSKLLLSGFWSLARHMNYTGDIILSTAYCLPCGSNHTIPYFYAIYMTILLITRCMRDEGRCFSKYKDKWTIYCNIVKYRLIPGIF